MNRKTFVIAALAAALVIAALAPFIASSNPDGLEGAFYGIFGAKDITGSELDRDRAAAAEEEVTGITGNTFSLASPFPDYSIGGLAKSGEAAAVIIGTISVLAIAYGLTRIVRRPE